jgi:hypothetical protein
VKGLRKKRLKYSLIDPGSTRMRDCMEAVMRMHSIVIMIWTKRGRTPFASQSVPKASRATGAK